MSDIIINDLEINKELSRQALQELKGGVIRCVKGRLGDPNNLTFFCRHRIKDYLSTQPNTFNGYSFT